MSAYKVCYGNAFNPAPHEADEWPKCLSNTWMVGTVDKLNHTIYVLGLSSQDSVQNGTNASATTH